MKHLDNETLPDLTLHLPVDNYATHKHPEVKSWIAWRSARQRRPRGNERIVQHISGLEMTARAAIVTTSAYTHCDRSGFSELPSTMAFCRSHAGGLPYMSDRSIGAFIGELAITPVGDGVHWQLIREFGFVDKRAVRWMVPDKTRVDGASIPRALWSIVGSPFTGKYVQASVIHDYYCDVRVREWRHVHRIFYEAMLVSGVSETRAKIMYAAVYFAGPRWSDTVIHNNNLDRLFKVDASRFAKGLSTIVSADGIAVRDYVEDSGNTFQAPAILELDLDAFEHLVTQFNPSLREIAEALDATLSVASETPVDRQIRSTGGLGLEQ